MVSTTRTLNPLPFQDLEPHRFEDLIRQLAYDFKNWRRLEATGRAGSDDGFDVRGLEIVDAGTQDVTDSEEDVAEIIPQNDRLWLIQCKREKVISPKKLSAYLDAIATLPDQAIYGIVFAAPCNFSKAAYDVFLSKCREKGVAEAVLWGRGELEDLLFQPKNDGLLFAYFGISLIHRRRTLKSEVRGRLATKKKLERLSEKSHFLPALIRDASELRYPFRKLIPDFRTRPRWIIRRFQAVDYRGAVFVLRRHFAAFAVGANQWDAAMAFDDEIHPEGDPWHEPREQPIERGAVLNFWAGLPESQRAWLEILGAIEFDRIVAIDDTGDNIARMPHIYVELSGGEIPFVCEAVVTAMQAHNGRRIDPEDENDRRVAIFPEEMRPRPRSETAS